MKLSTAQLSDLVKSGDLSKSLVIANLSKRERAVFAFARKNKSISSADVAGHLHISQANAINLLSRLTTIGLLQRQAIQGKHQPFYVWSILA